MSLQQRLDRFKAAFRAGEPPYSVSPDVIATMDRATHQLVASGAARLALKAGDMAPAFTLQDPGGETVSSRGLLARGPLIVSFYRGVWCPYCNMELQALHEALAIFREAGASLVAISPQTRANSRKSMRENGLDFPILSDPGNAVAAAFGIRFRMPDELVALYRSLGNNLPAINGEASWTLPMPARFVIGQDGVVRYAEVNPDYTRRPEPLEMLPAILAAQPRAA
jgi:peroxiredoxin